MEARSAQHAVTAAASATPRRFQASDIGNLRTSRLARGLNHLVHQRARTAGAANISLAHRRRHDPEHQVLIIVAAVDPLSCSAIYDIGLGPGVTPFDNAM